ncbi:MAG: hypothetical protein AAFN74_19820 [Myxococcota bacterium]
MAQAPSVQIEASETTPPESAPPQHRLEASLNLQRKAALASGSATDHAGRVQVMPMAGFDMNRTIFGNLEGTLARMVMHDKVAKEAFWSDAAVHDIETAYAASEQAQPTPAVDKRLIDFMVDECDFSMEHADGSFLQHLVFCHDYSAKYFPEHSANVALLHSILGTATNTFAMTVDKLPQLRALLTDFEALQVEAFPSLLRLFYDGGLMPELTANLHRLDKLDSVRFHRVIDNEPMELDAENLWINLNFHLMHFVDFMPTANWASHMDDPLLVQFQALSVFLDKANQRRAQVTVTFPESAQPPVGEAKTLVGRLSKAIPISVKKSLAQKSIRQYSQKIGHSLDYELKWKS